MSKVVKKFLIEFMVVKLVLIVFYLKCDVVVKIEKVIESDIYLKNSVVIKIYIFLFVYKKVNKIIVIKILYMMKIFLN